MSIWKFFGHKKPQDEVAAASESKEKGGLFAASVLLSEAKFSFEQFVSDLKADWGITLDSEDTAHDSDTMVVNVDGMMAAVSLFPAPVPNGEAESNAKTNYRWPGAVKAAQKHKAHLFIAMLPQGQPLPEAGIALVRLCASALGQETAVAVNTAGTVFAPDFYIDYARLYLDNDMYPVMNLVFFGLYSNDDGKTFCSYTYGLKDSFGREEIEVIDSAHSPQELLGFMTDVATYVIESDAELRDGETIGFSEEQKLPITQSPSAVLEGETVKIGF